MGKSSSGEEKTCRWSGVLSNRRVVNYIRQTELDYLTYQSPRTPLESLVDGAWILADRHHLGTLANLDASFRQLREDPRAILGKIMV